MHNSNQFKVPQILTSLINTLKMLNAYSDRVFSCGVDIDILKTMDFIIQEVLRSENEIDHFSQKESTKIYKDEHLKYLNSNKSVTPVEEDEILGSVNFIVEKVLGFENSECQNSSVNLHENSNHSINAETKRVESKLGTAPELMTKSQVLQEIEDDIRGSEKSLKCDHDLNFDSNSITKKELFVKKLGLASCVNDTSSFNSGRDNTVDESQANLTESPKVPKIKNNESVHFNSPIAVVHEYTISQTSEACSTQPLVDEDIDHNEDYSQDINQCEEIEIAILNQSDEMKLESLARKKAPAFESLIENYKKEQNEQNLQQQHALKSADNSLKGETQSRNTPCNLKNLCTLVCEKLVKIQEGNCKENITYEDECQNYHNEENVFTEDTDKVNGSELVLTELQNDHTSKEITKEHGKDLLNCEYKQELMTPGGDAYTAIQTQYLLAEPSQQNIMNETDTKIHTQCKSAISENQLNGNDLIGTDLEELQNMENELYEPFGYKVPVKEFFSKEPTGCSKLLASPDLFLDNYCDSCTMDYSESQAGSQENECATNEKNQNIGINEQVEDEGTETKLDGEILEESNEENIVLKNNSMIDNDLVESTTEKFDIETKKVERKAKDEPVELESKFYDEGPVAKFQNNIYCQNLEVDKQMDKEMESKNYNKISEESIESKFGSRGGGLKPETEEENKVKEESMEVKLDDYCQTDNDTCINLLKIENQNENILKYENCADKDESSDEMAEYKAEQSQERSLGPSAASKRKLFLSKVEIDHSPSKVPKINHNPACSSLELKQPVTLQVLAKQIIDKSEELTLWCTEDTIVYDSTSFVENQSPDGVSLVQNMINSQQANTTRDNNLTETSVFYCKTNERLDEPMKDQTCKDNTDGKVIEKIDSSLDKRKGNEYRGFMSATEHLSQSSQGSSTVFVFHPVLQEDNISGTNDSQNSITGVMVIHECYDEETFEDSHSKTQYLEHSEKKPFTKFDLSDLDSYIDKSIDQIVPGEEINLMDNHNHGEETDNQIPLYTCDVDLYCETDKQVCVQGEKTEDKCRPTKQGEFRWKYAPSIDLESKSTTTSDLDLEHQAVRIVPLKTCGKPIRLGLSKKQSLVHLHKLSQNKP